MADFTELQARAFLDACLALRRGTSNRIDSLACVLFRFEDREAPVAVRLEYGESGLLDAIDVATGPQAAVDVQRFAISQALPGEVPAFEFPSCRAEFAPIAAAPEEALEIFRLARAPYPKESIVPFLASRSASGASRSANRSERRLLFRVVIALRELAPRFEELFRDAVGTVPPIEVQIGGSPLKPRFDTRVRDDAAWWNTIDVRTALGPHRAPPSLPLGDHAWRIDVVGLSDRNELDGHDGGTPALIVITEPDPPRVVGAFFSAADRVPTVLSVLGRLVGELAASRQIDTLPRRIECDTIPSAALRGWFSRDDIDIAPSEPLSTHRSFLDRNLDDLVERATEIGAAAQMRSPVTDYEWFDCRMALVETFGEYLERLDEAEVRKLSRAFCGVESLLEESIDEPSVLEAITNWQLAFHPENDETWLPYAKSADPNFAAGARAFVNALRGSPTSVYRVASIVDRERVQLVDVQSLESTVTYALDLADEGLVNTLVFGRLVRIGGASLLAAFTPCVEPYLFRALLDELDEIGPRMMGTSLANDERLGGVFNWLRYATEEIADPAPYFDEDLDASDPSSVATSRMLEYVMAPGITIGGSPLGKTRTNEALATKARILLGAFPSLVLDDGQVAEPDRAHVASSLGLSLPAR